MPEEINAIMGLTLGGRPLGTILPTDYSVASSPLDQFINAGHITGDKQFSTNFASAGYNSFIDFGPFREDNMSDPQALQSFAVENGYFWATKPEGVRFGAVGEATEYLLDAYTGVFSSSSIFSAVPESLSENFFKILLEDKDYELEEGVFYTSCSTTFDHD